MLDINMKYHWCGVYKLNETQLRKLDKSTDFRKVLAMKISLLNVITMAIISIEVMLKV